MTITLMIGTASQSSFNTEVVDEVHRSVGSGTNVIHYKWLRFANNNSINALMVCLDVTT